MLITTTEERSASRSSSNQSHGAVPPQYRGTKALRAVSIAITPEVSSASESPTSTIVELLASGVGHPDGDAT